MLPFLFGLAFAQTPAAMGTLVFDARLPAELVVDGQPLVELYKAARVEIELPVGTRNLRVYTNGTSSDLAVVVPATGSVQVLAGRTGLTVGNPAPGVEPAAEVVAAADIPIQLRMGDPIGARVYLDDKRYQVGAGSQVDLALPAGPHTLSVRSENGTVVWAQGLLTVTGPDPVVVQLTEGRVPEVTGKGGFSSRQ